MISRLPEFEELRDEAVAIKRHTLANLDFYLESFERNVEAAGGKVHWCRDAAEASETVLAICRDLGAKTVTKGKSMIGEEIAVNDYLEANGIDPGRDRSRRIHHPAPPRRRRATSSPRRSIW